ncbi:complement C1q subcomponent subunit A [Bufo bufo]|uniref:complement C1q subcomponent subunit A n=1 Tax=Bufo bufo TaxID=8384 RepID=UPI001ABE957C|nr:complement C1q subcomponent subunit A [Bufo bufo]
MESFWVFFTVFLLGGSNLIWCQSDDCSAVKGQDGVMGRPGRDGRSGHKGDRGDPGAPSQILGQTASKGDAGDPGAPGEPGNVGYIGLEGPPGPSGDQGPKGSKGPPADTSAQHKPAFSAIQHNIKENRLVFTKTITNEENTYDRHTGEFTCKEPGYYYFTFQVVSLGDLCLQIWIKKSGDEGKKLLSFCDRNVRSQPQVNSGGSVLNLDTGDQVWIATDDKNRRIAGAEVSSIFSGFLLFPRVE